MKTNMNQKQSIKYYISPFTLDFIRSLKLVLTNPMYKILIKHNKKWEGKYNGEKVFIIANGPSLNSIDKKHFFGKKVIVMNNFEKAEWKDQVEIIAHCIGEPFSSHGWMKEDLESSIHGTNSSSYWLHFSSKDKLNEMGKTHLVHYVFAAVEPGIYIKKSIKLHEKTLGYQTTAQLAIQVAIYMGFQEIALVGFDHDWLASPNYSKHFYSLRKDKTDKLGSMKYLDIINFMQRMWIIYYKMKEIAINNSINIYNYSVPTFLDVFEQKKF